MEEDAVSFWKRVNELIKLQNKKQESVTKDYEISYQTFRGWVTRKAFPGGDDLFHIAQNLGVTVEYLITGKARHLRRYPESSRPA